MVCNIKKNFARKGRWVKDGHCTLNPDMSSYAGAVSEENIRSMLTRNTLHGVPVFAVDVCNANLKAPIPEKHCIVCGHGFRIENVGKKDLITRALYGRKYAGRDFWYHFRSCMKFLGFESQRADPKSGIDMDLFQRQDWSYSIHSTP